MRIVISEPDWPVLELLAPLVAAAVEAGHALAVLSHDSTRSEPTLHSMTEVQDPSDAISASAWDPDVVIAAEGDSAGAGVAEALRLPWLEVARAPSVSDASRTGRPPVARIVQDPTSAALGDTAVTVHIPMRPPLPRVRAVPTSPFPSSDFRVRLLVLGNDAREDDRALFDSLDLRELQVLASGTSEIVESDMVRRAPSGVRVTELLSMADVVVTEPRFALVMDALVQGVPLVLLPGTEAENDFAARLEDIGAALRVTEGGAVGAAVRTMIRRPQAFASAAALGRDVLVRLPAEEALLRGLVEAVLAEPISAPRSSSPA
jgi:hypothetical protein